VRQPPTNRRSAYRIEQSLLYDIYEDDAKQNGEREGLATDGLGSAHRHARGSDGGGRLLCRLDTRVLCDRTATR